MTGKKPKKPTTTRKAAKPAKSKPAPRTATATKRAKAAAPLRASAPKKVGALSASEPQAKSTAHAAYHPETNVPPLHQPPASDVGPAPHLITMARPWMMLGAEMTAMAFSFHARMAQAAMAIAQPATFNPWLAAMQSQRDKSRKS